MRFFNVGRFGNEYAYRKSVMKGRLWVLYRHWSRSSLSFTDADQAACHTVDKILASPKW